jgi:hypothetical protein
MAARKPELKFPIDDIAKAIAKVLKQSSKPSRSVVRNNVRADVRRGQYNTIRKDPTTKGMSDEQIIKHVAKGKPRVTRNQVKNIRSTYKGGR